MDGSIDGLTRLEPAHCREELERPGRIELGDLDKPIGSAMGFQGLSWRRW